MIQDAQYLILLLALTTGDTREQFAQASQVKKRVRTRGMIRAIFGDPLYACLCLVVLGIFGEDTLLEDPIKHFSCHCSFMHLLKRLHLPRMLTVVVIAAIGGLFYGLLINNLDVGTSEHDARGGFWGRCEEVLA